MDKRGKNSDSNSNGSDLLMPAIRPAVGSDIAGFGEFSVSEMGGGPGHSPVMASLVASMLRRKWLILIVAMIVAGASIPCIWFFFAPSYRATAVVRIQPVIEKVVFNTERSGMLPLYQSFVNTEVSIIRSPKVMERLLDQQEMKETQWYKETNKRAQTGSTELLEELQLHLEVNPRQGTELIDVSFNAPKAADAKVIADLVVDVYCKLKEELDQLNKINLYETLNQQLNSLQQQIEGDIHARFNTSKMLGTDAPEQLRLQLSQKFNMTESEVRKARLDLDLMQWELKKMVSAETKPSDVAEDHRYVGDADWRRLHFNLEEARHAVEIGKQTMGPVNPRMKALVADAEHAEKVLKGRSAEIDEMWKHTTSGDPNATSFTQSRDGLKFQADKKMAEINLMQVELEHQRTKLNDAGEIALDISNYDERIRQKRELYEQVRVRRQQLEMEEKAPGRVVVAARAIEPFKPYNDRRLLYTVAAIVLALGAGIGVGYLRTTMDKLIYDPKEIQNLCRVPFLGMLPRLPAADVPRELGGVPADARPITDTLIDPRIVLMENMRMIRTTFLERVSQTGERVVLVTSCLPHTGKTSVAVLLAQSLALVGKKILLVEADLRRPVLGDRLGVNAKLGLGALLCGNANDQEVVHRAEFARFDLVPAGDLPDNFNPELMANGVFSGCIAHWRKAYDFVLLDSPPLLRVADAQILAGSADGTIMVLRSSHDRRNEAMQALTLLNSVGGTLLGTVLIGDQLGHGYYGKYGYDYDYSYGNRLIEQKKSSETTASTTGR